MLPWWMEMGIRLELMSKVALVLDADVKIMIPCRNGSCFFICSNSVDARIIAIFSIQDMHTQ
jgi:hypothetical protein